MSILIFTVLMNQLPVYTHFQQTLLPNTTHNPSMALVNTTNAVHLTSWGRN